MLSICHNMPKKDKNIIDMEGLKWILSHMGL